MWLGNLVITCVLVTELELPGEHIGYPLLPLVQGVYKNGVQSIGFFTVLTPLLSSLPGIFPLDVLKLLDSEMLGRWKAS